MYGRVVRQARTERGLSQVELSRISGVGQSNISAIERGRRVPTAETLHCLLFACGYELLAVAGERVLAFPPPDDIGVVDDTLSTEQAIDRHGAAPAIPMARRVRMVAAALDAAEAIVRAR